MDEEGKEKKPPDPDITLPEQMDVTQSQIEQSQSLFTPIDPPNPQDPQNASSSKEPQRQGVKRSLLTEENIASPDIKKTIVHPDIANAAEETIYLHPSLSLVKLYRSEDKGPYIVHIFRIEADPAAGTSIRAIKFGQFLYQHGIKNIAQGGVRNIGRNRIEVEFKSPEDANNFVTHSALQPAKYGAMIPSYHVTRMGLVRDVPVEWSMTELVDCIEVPSGFGQIIKARRLKRKGLDGHPSVPTPVVVLTFSGQALPERVYCFNSSLPVETYQLPTIQCNNCWRYGHVHRQCRSRTRCRKCGDSHTGDVCQLPENEAICVHCSGNHAADNKDCPELGRQKCIKIIMSQENVPYSQAATRCPPARRSYAEMAKTPSQPSYPSLVTLSPPLTQSSSLQTPPIQKSYKKTTFTPPRPRPQLEKGYDVEAHRNLIRDYDAPQPSNGCALQNPCQPSPNENLIDLLISVLINILSKFNDSDLPPYVAQKLSTLINLFSKHGLDPTVEQ